MLIWNKNNKDSLRNICHMNLTELKRLTTFLIWLAFKVSMLGVSLARDESFPVNATATPCVVRALFFNHDFLPLSWGLIRFKPSPRNWLMSRPRAMEDSAADFLDLGSATSVTGFETGALRSKARPAWREESAIGALQSTENVAMLEITAKPNPSPKFTSPLQTWSSELTTATEVSRLKKNDGWETKITMNAPSHEYSAHNNKFSENRRLQVHTLGAKSSLCWTCPRAQTSPQTAISVTHKIRWLENHIRTRRHVHTWDSQM